MINFILHLFFHLYHTMTTYLSPHQLAPSIDGRLPTEYRGYPIATSNVTPGYSSQIPTQRMVVPPNVRPINQPTIVTSPPPVYGGPTIPQGSRIVVGSTTPLIAPQPQYVAPLPSSGYGVLAGNQAFVQGVPQYSGSLYSNIVGFKQPKQTERRVTYHPYTRTYVDYEERVIMVPVQKVKLNYYQKIYETEFVPQAKEEIVVEMMPVQKIVQKVEYIPVERKIIHFPKDQKGYTVVSKQLQALKQKAQIQQKKSNTQQFQQSQKITYQGLQPAVSQKVFLAQNDQKYFSNTATKEVKNNPFKESFVREIYSSNHNILPEETSPIKRY